MPRTFGQHYILVGGEPQPVAFEEFMAWVREHIDETRVAYTQLGEVLVSTIFLGMDHNFHSRDTPPLLFETMVFGGPLDHKFFRSRTRAEALRAPGLPFLRGFLMGCEHERVCSLVQNFQA